MGRAERRMMERRNRIENHKNKISMTRDELRQIKKKVSTDVSDYNVELLMTCFALAEHRLYGFGKKRIFRSLQYIDELMGGINNDPTIVDEYKKELDVEAGVRIVCSPTGGE